MASLPGAWLALRLTALLTGWCAWLALAGPDAPRLRTVGVLGIVALGAYVSAHMDNPGWASVSRFVSLTFLVIFAGLGGWVVVGRAGMDAGTMRALVLAIFFAHCFAQRTRRDVLVGVTLSLFMCVLPVGTSAEPQLSVLLVLCWLGAVTALVLAHHIAHQETAAVVAVRNRAVGTDGVRPVATMAVAVTMAMVLGFLVFLVLPRPSGAAARRSVAGRVPRPFETSGRSTRSVGSYVGGGLDLRARGPLPDTPMLDVPENSPALWRGAVLDTYDGTTWTQQVYPLVVERSAAGYVVSPDPVPADLPPRRARTDSVRLLAPGQAFLLVAPGQPTLVQTEAQMVNGPAGPLLVNRRRAADYVVASRSTTADAGALARSSGPNPDDARWTALPPGLPARVRALAATLASPTGNRLETVEAIERDLRSRATYRLDPPVPRQGQDAVDHFLFDAQTGFCEHFASAEVVLLRSLGIPARLVTGFTGGEPASAGRRLIRAKQAHAWVEVWYPGVGWVSSDPTAGATPAESSGSWLSRVTAAISKALATGRGRALIAAGLVTVVVAAWGVWWLVRRRRAVRRTAPRSVVFGGPLLSAFGRLEVAMATTGQASPPAETLSELSGRLSRRPEETWALDVVERACYSGSPPSAQEEHLAAVAIDAIATRLLADNRTREVSGTG